MPKPSAANPIPNRRNEGGFALVLVIIFTVLLVAIVTELITTAKLARLTGENDALLSRMRMHMSYVLSQIEDTLKDDLNAGQAQAGAQGGGAPAGGGSPIPGGAGGGQQQQGNVDSSQDPWFEPTSYSEGELTTYVWVEDENRKFNILSLASPDEEFARESKDRFVRLIDAFREQSDYDLGTSDGERLARVITEWLQGNNRSETLPKAPLKSDLDDRRQMTIPLQLEELLLLPGIDEDLYYDRVIDQKLVPGLESVLTLYTSLTFDPGDPTKQQAQKKPASGGQAGDSQVGQSGRTPQQPQAGQGQAGGAKPPATGANGKPEPVQPTGIGVRINVNTASRAVIRSLFTTAEMPDAVIEALLRYRNEEAPPEEENAQGGGAAGGQGNTQSQTPQRTSYASGASSGEIASGEQKKHKIFSSLADLDKVPEYQNLANQAVKTKLAELMTTESDVFTIHMASLFKRNEKTKSFVIRRARSVEVRIADGDTPVLHPLMLLEDTKGLRVMPVDFPLDEAVLRQQQSEMDAYSAEERAWNPFYLDFYKPKPEGG